MFLSGLVGEFLLEFLIEDPSFSSKLLRLTYKHVIYNTRLCAYLTVENDCFSSLLFQEAGLLSWSCFLPSLYIVDCMNLENFLSKET